MVNLVAHFGTFRLTSVAEKPYRALMRAVGAVTSRCFFALLGPPD
jgi:hypothetical protein